MKTPPETAGYHPEAVRIVSRSEFPEDFCFSEPEYAELFVKLFREQLRWTRVSNKRGYWLFSEDGKKWERDDIERAYNYMELLARSIALTCARPGRPPWPKTLVMCSYSSVRSLLRIARTRPDSWADDR